MFVRDICTLCVCLCKLHASAAVSVWLFIYSYPLLLYDLEKTTFSNAPLSFTSYSQIHDSYRHRQSGALAEVFGCCDSDDSLDADNGNGCMVVLFSVLYTKPV